MPYVDEPRLQGTIYSGKSCEFDLGFGPLSGVQKNSADESRERKIVKGSRRDLKPVGLTVGDYEPGKLVFAFLEQTGQMVCEQMDTLGVGSVGDAVQDVVVSVFEPDNVNADPITTTYESAVLTKRKWTRDPTSDELVLEVELQPISVDQNGTVLWSPQRSV